jgi:hypothetical protein
MSEITIKDANNELSELDKVLDDALADSFVPQLVQAKIVHATASFSVEGMPDQSSITGIILSAKRQRVFFPKFSNQELNNKLHNLSEKRPYCSSTNCVKGDITQIDVDSVAGEVRNSVDMIRSKLAQGGLICKLCPFAKFGSVGDFGLSGRGQACNELRRLLFWKPDTKFPMIVTLPPTSIREFDGYMSSLDFGKRTANKVFTEISLIPVATGSTKYATARLAYKSDINQDILRLMLTPMVIDGIEKSFIKAMIDLFLNKAPEIDDYIGEANGSSDDKF